MFQFHPRLLFWMSVSPNQAGSVLLFHVGIIITFFHVDAPLLLVELSQIAVEVIVDFGPLANVLVAAGPLDGFHTVEADVDLHC